MSATQTVAENVPRLADLAERNLRARHLHDHPNCRPGPVERCASIAYRGDWEEIKAARAIATVRPAVVVDITGGVPQWEITVSGTGEPYLWVLDFDKESEPEWMEQTLADAEEAYKTVQGRATGERERLAVVTLRRAIDDLARRLAANRAS
jgi:hypothetical protein